jgi:von Willebrand factor type A domain
MGKFRGQRWFGPAMALLMTGCAGVRDDHGSVGPLGGAGGGSGNGARAGSSSRGGAQGTASGSGGRSDTSSGDTTPPPPPANCGITKHSADRLPPDVLIVLDRSALMNDPVMPVTDVAGLLTCLAGGPCPSKWQDMTGALNASVAASASAVNWGLKFFANDGACGVSDMVAVPVAGNNASAISAAIAGTRPGGFTPTTAGLQAAGRYLMGLTDPNPKFIVLATDGQPNCGATLAGGADDQAAIDSVSALAGAGIPVFVIGVATQGSTADSTLSAMATKGGKPRAATPPYYPVAVGADLTAALQAISSQVVSCSFQIPAPPDPNNVAVDADGMRVPKSPTDGWSYGPNMTSIVLNGTWCTKLQSGTVEAVEASFACGITIIP